MTGDATERSLAALARLAADTGSTLAPVSLDSLLQSIVATAQCLTGAAAGSIALLDDAELVFRVATYGELDDALEAAAAVQDRLVLIEAVVPQMDIPPLLTELAQSASAANAGTPSRIRSSR